MTPQAGDQLDQFRLENEVARSGMATVYRATDTTTGKQVAIKIPHPEMESDPVLFDRFKREEDIGTRLEHSGVMKVFANPNRSRVYMVMEWLDGRLLRYIMNEQKPLPIERAIHITVGICEALEYIHTHGVVHRDLKPENVMVSGDDHIALIDFGIAANAGSRRLTFANFSQIMATPDYISPEQVKGKRGDERSDVYTLGVMLYEMVTGSVPFTGVNPFAVMNDRLLNQPPPPRTLNPDISPELQETIYRAMERDPNNRYPTAREFAHDLLHPETVGLTERTAEAQWQKRQSPGVRRILFYVSLVLLPIVVFGLLLYVAKHH